MNNAQEKLERSRPEILAHLFVIAVVLSSVLMNCLRPDPSSLISMQQYAYISLINQTLTFPWWMTCVLWLASRSGQTSPTTWLVPCALLIFASSAYFLIKLFFVLSTGVSDPGMMFMPDWQGVLGPSLISFVYMSFAFRTSTLHLRPVEAPTSLHRLRVFDIMLLTSVVAVCLSVDALLNRLQSTDASGVQASFRIWESLMSWFYFLPTSLLWFSFAWLLVEKQPRRWIGFVGLAIYLAFSVLYYLVILPFYISQAEVALGSTITSFEWESWYVLTSFAILIFHAAIAFLCVFVMYWKGYRWDFYNKTPTD